MTSIKNANISRQMDQDQDVEKGLSQKVTDESKDEINQDDEEEEGCLEKILPDCINENMPQIMFFLLVAWGLTCDTALATWDVVSDYMLADKHFRYVYRDSTVLLHF